MAFPATGMFVPTFVKSLKLAGGYDTPPLITINGFGGIFAGCSLYTNSVTTDLTTNIEEIFVSGQFFSNEIVGTGYTTGGYKFTGAAFGHTTGGVVSYTNSSNPNWTSSTLSNVQGCVYYVPVNETTVKQVGLMAYNFGTAVSTVSGTLTISLASNVIFSFDLIP